MEKLAPRSRVTKLPSEVSGPEIGEWYWLTMDEHERQWYKADRLLCCVTHLGSNYAELSTVGSASFRCHFDHFSTLCEREHNAEAYIQRRIAEKQERVQALMQEVRNITARLGVSITDLQLEAAAPAGETQALSTQRRPMSEYKEALQKAKKEELPALFKEIEEENGAMARWMTASLLPLKAQVAQLQPAIKQIENRIFNVEIYAGLTEEIEQVRGGAPARIEEPIHLFQRRHYMDEECLAQYEAGGMEFADIAAFDAWLLRPENLSRLLPLSRCVVAFRVRRHDKERDIYTLADFIKFRERWKLDKFTYLYLRNGERVYRLRTAIEFDAKLFPDLASTQYEDCKVFAHMWGGGRVERIYTEHQIAEEKIRKKQEIKEAEAALRQAIADGAPKSMIDHKRWMVSRAKERRDWENVEPFSPESVHYDDIAAYIKAQMDQHNRVVMILQGLLDRSEVFHPHPPYRLWEPEGFARALVLHYDQDRALPATQRPPDFEEYRRRLNSLLKVGDWTVGQEDAWMEREAEKENARRYRERPLSRHQPYGNPGPGLIAQVSKMTRAGALYRWERQRRGYGRRWSSKARPGDAMACTFTAPLARIFNVSAYTPGDFRLFYADPRTRAEYLEWAPFLLRAEDWHHEQRGSEPRRRRKR